jgi:hypothetical protein
MNRNLLKRANRRALGAAAVTTALLVPLGVFGAPALARSAAASSQYGGSAEYQYKITICHHTHSKKHPMHTIKVSVNAWKAHQKHGDTLGACPATVAAAAAAKHGKSGEHGKSNNDTHGNSGTKGDSGDNGNGHGKGHGK